MLMEEALICLKERAGGKLVRAFEIARNARNHPAPLPRLPA
jgi:hypothetical protein